MLSEAFHKLRSTPKGRFTAKDGSICDFKIYGRGEHLIFKQDDKVLLCHYNYIQPGIYLESVKNWEGSDVLFSKSERVRIAGLIKATYDAVVGENEFKIFEGHS